MRMIVSDGSQNAAATVFNAHLPCAGVAARVHRQVFASAAGDDPGVQWRAESVSAIGPSLTL
jgi:hypothetical protein